MDFTVSLGLKDYASALPQARRTASYAQAKQANQANQANTEGTESKALVPKQVSTADGTRLVSENREDLESGRYRVIRTYQQEDGRNLTKIEEFSLTERGAKKTITQQNPSGSITRYEEVLERESNGNFRRTQRFQEGNGDVATNITANYQVMDSFVLTGGQGFAGASPMPFSPTRGTQLDLRA